MGAISFSIIPRTFFLSAFSSSVSKSSNW
uniref:Glutaryl-CoA dehydrogenase n=1 Tax=Arundo donax TaxID=35708 RepID=A0A0A9GW06_ARUDO